MTGQWTRVGLGVFTLTKRACPILDDDPNLLVYLYVSVNFNKYYYMIF